MKKFALLLVLSLGFFKLGAMEVEKIELEGENEEVSQAEMCAKSLLNAQTIEQVNEILKEIDCQGEVGFELLEQVIKLFYQHLPEVPSNVKRNQRFYTLKFVEMVPHFFVLKQIKDCAIKRVD